MVKEVTFQASPSAFYVIYTDTSLRTNATRAMIYVHNHVQHACLQAAAVIPVDG